MPHAVFHVPSAACASLFCAGQLDAILFLWASICTWNLFSSVSHSFIRGLLHSRTVVWIRCLKKAAAGPGQNPQIATGHEYNSHVQVTDYRVCSGGAKWNGKNGPGWLASLKINWKACDVSCDQCAWHHVSITWTHGMQFHIWCRHQAADRAFTALVVCSTLLLEGAKLPSKPLVPFPHFFFYSHGPSSHRDTRKHQIVNVILYILSFLQPC